MQLVKKPLKIILLTLGVASLFACGGGGGSSSPTTTPSSPAITSSSSSTSSSASVAPSPSTSSSSSSSSTSLVSEDGTFTNPLFTNGADPYLTFYQGNYYLTTTTWTSQIVMRKSATLAGLKTAKPVYVWSDNTAERCCNFWAFEFHRLNGPNGYRWYMLFTAGVSGNFGGQKLRVLESAGDDPMGPYTYKSTPMPSTWNIDGTYLEHNNNLYLIWSEFLGNSQNVWIAAMENPWTIKGSRTVISAPTFAWEKSGDPVNEGPIVIKRNGKTFVVFSGSSCTTPDYKLGQIELTGLDPLQATSWTKKSEALFQRTETVFGPGHNGFFKSPDNSEDWIVYHANATAAEGCYISRSVRMQKISWNTDDSPNLGTPVSPGEMLTAPSGEKNVVAKTLGASYRVINKKAGLCLGVTNNALVADSNLALVSCDASTSEWIFDSTGDGAYRLNNAASQLFAGVGTCATNNTATLGAWKNQNCQRWQFSVTTDGWLSIKNQSSGKQLAAQGCSTVSNSLIEQAASTDCGDWRIEPINNAMIVNINSGKVLQGINCATSAGVGIEQSELANTNCQKWKFKPTDNGYLQIQSTVTPSSCVSIDSASTNAGASLAQAACSGHSAQWRLEPLSDGTLKIVSRHSGLAIDVVNCALYNTAAIDQYTWLDNNCQRFVLK